MRRFGAVLIILLLLLSVAVGVGGGTPKPKLKSATAELRDVPKYDTLTFNNVHDMEEFFKQNDFGYGTLNGITWSIGVSIHSSSLMYTHNGITTFVFVPILVKSRSSGEVKELAPDTQFYFANIPMHTRIIMAGFEKTTIFISNCKGQFVLGGMVSLQYSVVYSFLGYGVSISTDKVSVSGLRNVAISVTQANNVTITNYVGDTSKYPMISIAHAHVVYLSGVSLVSWNNQEGSTALRIVDTDRVVISNGLGKKVSYDGKYIRSMFGLYTRGYATGILLDRIQNLTVYGTVDLGGWEEMRAQSGIFAENVNHTYVAKAGVIHLNNEESYLNFDFEVTWVLSKIYNKSTSQLIATERVFKGGNYTDIYGSAYNESGAYTYFEDTINEPASLFAYRTVRNETWGLDLSSYNLSGNVKPTGMSVNWTNESQVGLVFGYDVMWDSVAGTIYNISTEHNGTVRLQFVASEKDNHPASSFSIVLNDVDNKSSRYSGANYTWENTTYTWHGTVVASAIVNATVQRSAGAFYVQDSDNGLGVPDNGTNEKELASYFESLNGTSQLRNVGKAVGYNLRSPYTESTGINALLPYLGLSAMMTFLVAFAVVRWAYSTITGGDSPEELAKNKQLLKQIFIGGLIIFFVLFNFGLLLNIFTIP